MFVCVCVCTGAGLACVIHVWQWELSDSSGLDLSFSMITNTDKPILKHGISLIFKFSISDFAPKAYWISYTLEDGSHCKFNKSYFHGPCILCSTQTKHWHAALVRTVLRRKLNFKDRKQFVSTNLFSPVLVCTRVARVCECACVCVRACIVILTFSNPNWVLWST